MLRHLEESTGRQVEELSELLVHILLPEARRAEMCQLVDRYVESILLSVLTQMSMEKYIPLKYTVVWMSVIISPSGFLIFATAVATYKEFLC